MASDSWPSKRFTEEFRALQPISPRQFDRFGNADPQPRDDVRFFRARIQRDGRGIQRQAVVLVGNPKRFGQLARPRAQQSLIMQSTAPAACGTPWVGCTARISTALAEPSFSQTKLTHQWMP